MAQEGLGPGVQDAEQQQRERPRPDLCGLGRRVLEVESNSVLIATVALILFIGIVRPNFLAWGQPKEVVQNATYVGIIAGALAPRCATACPCCARVACGRSWPATTCARTPCSRR